MNLKKPLLLNPHNLLKQVGKIDSIQIIELLEDNALKAMELYSLEESLKKHKKKDNNEIAKWTERKKERKKEIKQERKDERKKERQKRMKQQERNKL